MSIMWLMDVWMSELHIFNWRESLISSQVLCKVKAANINVLTSPLDFTCASLVLFSPIHSEAVSSLSANPPTVRSHFHLM